MIEFVNKSVKDETKRINCKEIILYYCIYLVYNELVACIQLVEAQREVYKKKYSLKFQFVLNNYGYIYSKLGKC
jgi:phage terminase large subunit GpA-like protein